MTGPGWGSHALIESFVFRQFSFFSKNPWTVILVHMVNCRELLQDETVTILGFMKE